MRGQKRVEDARERAYYPRIHLLRQKHFPKMMDCRVKPGNDGGLVRVALGQDELARTVSTASSRPDVQPP